MKLPASLTVLMATIGLQALSVYEGFDYPDGALATQGSGSGWMADAGWGGFPRGNGIHNGVAGSSAMVVQAETLAAPADYALTRSGGQVNGGQAFSWGFREFAMENRINLDEEQTFYFSYLFSMLNISASQGSYAQLLFINADRTDLFRVGVHTALDAPSISTGGNTLLESGSRQVQPATAYLVVGRVVTGASGQTVSIQFYAESETIGSEPADWEVETTLNLAGALIDRIGLISGGMDNGIDHSTIYDELRIGESFAAVTGVGGGTEPTTWAGYPLDPESKDVDTAGFMGQLNVALSPWTWSYDLQRFVFLPETHVDGDGAWVYLPR